MTMKLAVLVLGVVSGACAWAGDAIGEALDVTMLPKCGTHLKDALFTRAYEADKRIDAEWVACADAESARTRQRTIRSAILDSMGGLVAARALEFGGRKPVIHAEGRAVIPAAHAFYCFRGRFGGFRTDREPRSWRSMIFDAYAPVRFANVVQYAYRHYDWTDLVRDEMMAETRRLQAAIDKVSAGGRRSSVKM